MLIEVHDNRAAPESCTIGLGDVYSSSEIINQIWVDDVELMTALQGMGVPVRLGSMEKADETIAGARSVTWTMKTEGFDDSWLTKPIVQEPNFRTSITYRRYWPNEVGGISYMDWDRTFYFNGQDPEPFVGMLGDPFLHVPGIDAYSDLGSILDEASVIATISHFGDMNCEQPLQ